MQKYRALAGIISTLPVFESAARLMSFTDAAEELHMTQPAVSRRIASLEQMLGVAVFRRDHNKLALTKHGFALLRAVDLDLGHLNKAVTDISRRAESAKLTVACGFSFAAMWLQPRFSRFRRMLDGLDVHLIASEFPDDLDPEMIDIRILWNEQTWPNRDVRELFSEETFPVCSRAFATRYGLDMNAESPLETMATLPLLHYDPGGPYNQSWSDWFRRQGIEYSPPESVYVFDNYQFTIQAALDDEGIALGYSVLLDDHLSRGNLVQVGQRGARQNSLIFIEFEPNRLSKKVRDTIHAWLSQEACTVTAEPPE